MKLAFAILGLFALCQLELLADDFRDFRIPNSRVVQTGLSFTTEFRRHMDDQEPPDYLRRTDLFQGGRTSMYHRLQTQSDRQTTYFSLNALAAEELTRAESSSNDEISNRRGEYLSKRYRLLSRSDAYLNRTWYWWRDLLGVSTTAFGRAEYEAGGGESSSYEYSEHSYWDSTGYNSVYGDEWSDSESESWGQDYGFLLRIGPVIGRRRDVTPVANALVMEQRLIEDGTLSGKLNAANRRALAELLAQASSYSMRYDYGRWEKYFRADIESILLRDPACHGPINAYSMERLFEYYLGSISRFRGFTVQPFFDYAHSNRIDHGWSRSSSLVIADPIYQTSQSEDYRRTHRHSDSYYLGVDLNWDIPLGLKWQYSMDSQFRHYTWRPLFHQPRHNAWIADAGAQLSWLMADKWLASGGLAARAEFRDEVGDDTWHSESVNADLWFQIRYLIERRVEVIAVTSDRYYWNKTRYLHYEIQGPFETQDHRDTEFRLGLSFAFRGALEPAYSYFHFPQY